MGVVHATLRVTNAAGLTTEVNSSPITINSSLPATPIITHGYGLYTANSDHLEYDWSLTPIPTYMLDHYEVVVTQTPTIPENAVWTDVGTETSYRYESELENGLTYYLFVRAIGKNQLVSEGISDVVTIDFTKPDLVDVNDQALYSSNNTDLSADYHVLEEESEINYICYALGTKENPEAIQEYQWVTYDPQNLTISARGNLDYNETYYFTVMASNVVGLFSDFASSDGVRIVEADSPKVTTINTGGLYTNDSSQLTFTWEVDDATMPFKGFRYGLVRSKDETPTTWFSTITPQCTITPEVLEEADVTVFEDGNYYLKVYATNMLNFDTPTATTADGIIVDAHVPDSPAIQVGNFTGETFNLKWSVNEVGISGVDQYQYALGSYPGATDLLAWQDLSSNQTDYNGSLELTLDHQQNFYLTVKVKNRAGTWSIPTNSDEIVVDLSGPTQPIVSVPEFSTSHTQLTGVTMSSDDLVSGVKKYRWDLVTATEKAALTTQGTLTTSDQTIEPIVENWSLTDVTLNTSLTADGEYYLALQTWDQVGNHSDIQFSDLIIVDTTGPTLNITPSDPDLVTNGESLTVDWTTSEAGELKYKIYLVDENGYEHIKDQGTTTITTQLTGSFPFDETDSGTYVIKVDQDDIYGNGSGEKTLDIRVNHQPTVALNKEALEYGVLYLFKGHRLDDTVTADDIEDGTVASYSWTVEEVESDGSLTLIHSVVDGTATFSYQLTEVGDYKVTVTVTDTDGGAGSDDLLATVTNTTSGTLVSDETWTGKDMIVEDDVTVPADLTLTITPGAEIMFMADTALIVEGTLIAQGTEAAPILLESSLDFAGFEWQGVKLITGASLGETFSYVTVHRAERGLTLMGQTGPVNQATFTSNLVGIHLVGGSPEIRNSIFQNNDQYGIKEDAGTTPTVTGCGFGLNGQADYYDLLFTWMTAEEINTLEGYDGNYTLEGVVGQ